MALVLNVENMINADYNEFRKMMTPSHRICEVLSEKYNALVMVPKDTKNTCFE